MDSDYRARYYREKRKQLSFSRNEIENTVLFDLEEMEREERKQLFMKITANDAWNQRKNVKTHYSNTAKVDEHIFIRESSKCAVI